MEQYVRRYGDGVLVYDPLYSWVEKAGDIIQQYRDLPISIGWQGASLIALKEVIDEFAVNLGELTVSLTATGAAWLLLQKLAGRVYRGVRQQVGPMQMEIAIFPDAPTQDEEGMIGQIVSASATE